MPGALLTDLYELNMAASYTRRQMNSQRPPSALRYTWLPAQPGASSGSRPAWRAASSFSRASASTRRTSNTSPQSDSARRA